MGLGGLRTGRPAPCMQIYDTYINIFIYLYIYYNIIYIYILENFLTDALILIKINI